MNKPMEKNEYKYMYQVEDELWWYKGLRDTLGYFLNRYIGSKAKILDAGCGTGKNFEYLMQQGYSVKGFDFSKEAITFCQKRKLRNVYKASITEIPEKANSYDAVICMDVIGMLDTNGIKQAFKEFNRVLKKDGYLFIHAAAFEFLRSQHDDVCRLQQRLTLPLLQQMYDSAEWNEIKLSYRIFLLFPVLLAVKLLKKLTKRFTKESHTDLVLPSPFINQTLFLIQQTENKILTHSNFPIGTSLFVILQKK